MTIGEKIKNLRTQTGMTQKELAAASSLSVMGIQNIEHGVSIPRTETLQQIAEGLGISVWTLIPGPDPHEVSAYEGFENYMKSIGYSVIHKVTKHHYETDEVDGQTSRFPVEDETECVLSKDGHSVTLTEAEYIDLSTRIEDQIEMIFHDLLIKKK